MSQGRLQKGLVVVGELALRQVYWRCCWLRGLRLRLKKRANVPSQRCDTKQLFEYLQQIGVEKGALVLAHTGLAGVEFTDINSVSARNPIGTASVLLDGLLNLLGPEGTLVMPTHARYQTEALDNENDPEELITYDPRRSPCSVGLVNELFWRRKGVKRSLFPLNMLAAHGPLAGVLLDDNLNERYPSPHGADSGYYRICHRNGLIISVGVRLRECMTMGHVVEETRPDWPVKNFFEQRKYRVVQDGETKEWMIRQTRSVFAKYCSLWRSANRDMVAEGVIREGNVGSVAVDWARAKDVYDFFYRKTEAWPYPHYGLWFKPGSWRRKN